MGVRLFVTALFLACAAESQQVTRIYVAGATKASSIAVARKDIISELRKLKSIQIVSSPQQANATLLTDGEIYIASFYSLNPRSGLTPAHGQPVYGGYLSVRVRSSDGDIVWSYFADTSRSTNAARELSKKVVRHFAETFSPPTASAPIANF